MNQFLRTEMLLGSAAVEKLRRCHVAVVGLGGVGSYAAEALARSGLGALTLVDHDTVSESNLNRQLGALHSTLGMNKCDVLAARAKDIDPELKIRALPLLYEAANRDEFFDTDYDYIIDAIDLVSCKLDLIETAMKRNIPIISCLGTGNRIDPSKLQISDISKTHSDPLARVVRKELRNRGIYKHAVMWSDEEPIKPVQLEAPPPGRRSQPASGAWVPGCAGLMLAGWVINELCKE